MHKLDKMASKDAFNWARAEMFFGEGAGTRRKLLSAEISEKTFRIPGYREAFERWYMEQDMAEHAIKAAKERKRLDRGKYVSKNARAIVRGDRRNVSMAVLVVGGAAWYMHETGYDKVLLEKAKIQKRRLEAWYVNR